MSSPRLLQELRARTDPKCVVKEVFPHPLLTRYCCIWVGGRRWPTKRTYFAEAAAKKTRDKGLSHLECRRLQWGVKNPNIHAALGHLKWQDIRRISGITAWGERLVYRLKVRGFRLYLTDSSRIGCPHPKCADHKGTLSHVFWHCTHAQELWKVFAHLWSSVGHTADIARPETVFAFAMTGLPRGFVDVLENKYRWTNPEHQSRILELLPQAAQNGRRIMVITVLQLIWKWRMEYLEPTPNATPTRYTALLRLRLRQSLYQLVATARDLNYPPAEFQAIDLVVDALTSQHVNILRPVPPTSSHYVLFFDGGSRGNPGPGGSGSVIIKVDARDGSFHPCWVASMAYGRQSTTLSTRAYYKAFSRTQSTFESHSRRWGQPTHCQAAARSTGAKGTPSSNTLPALPVNGRQMRSSHLVPPLPCL
ncbi:hypothetical protein V7S43_013624 [Phytophthora oleae]|uniref:Reverse transcriptase zinc-binding domain-containing protein n=1 Tax=Phytophthora oleae TaxID=2107226 RepID=A0ABD3F6V4_9STRA